MTSLRPAGVPAESDHEAQDSCLCFWCCIDRAAQLYVNAVAKRDSMSPREAARAAGARTEEQVADLAAEIRGMRVNRTGGGASD